MKLLGTQILGYFYWVFDTQFYNLNDFLRNKYSRLGVQNSKAFRLLIV